MSLAAMGARETALMAVHCRECFVYDPHTGSLRWRQGKWAGREAGYTLPSGHRRVRVSLNGHRIPLQAHRIAWLLYYGHWPPAELDHRNGVAWDNTIKNMREITHTGNQQNRVKPRADSGSGVQGVGWSKAKRRWEARIRVQGRRIYLGGYANIADAEAAYKAAKARWHTHCCQ